MIQDYKTKQLDKINFIIHTIMNGLSHQKKNNNEWLSSILIASWFPLVIAYLTLDKSMSKQDSHLPIVE